MIPFLVFAGLATGVYWGIKLKSVRGKRLIKEAV